MKVVSKVLMGAAASLTAVSMAQAADLPVKARKVGVEYVKVCSLYGAGFYYVPGTDTCLKVGGYVRAETAWGFGNSMTLGTFQAGRNTRTDNSDYNIRTKAYVTLDARTQSAYGTIRSYFSVGVSVDSGLGGTSSANNAGFSANRAFIQFAGFTFGTAQSFYDFYSAAAAAYLASIPSSDTGDPGWKVAAYTAQFGNGFSATISAEEPRITKGMVDTSVFGALKSLGSMSALQYNAKGIDAPDIVANLRIDQPWGAAQIMGALHEVSAGYYGIANGNGGITALTSNGHPGNTWGYALGAGLKIKFPWIGPGDYFDSQFNWTKGAQRYANFTPSGYNPYFYSGNSLAYGFTNDGVFCGAFAGAGGGTPAGGCAAGATATQLTTAWNFNLHYEHYWTPALHTSLYGGYLKESYNNQANRELCVAEFNNGGIFAGNGVAAGTAPGGCNNDWSWWWIGSRTQWDITKTLYVGLDVIYMNLNSAKSGLANTFVAAQGAQPAALRNIKDENSWSIRARVHRSFNP